MYTYIESLIGIIKLTEHNRMLSAIEFMGQDSIVQEQLGKCFYDDEQMEKDSRHERQELLYMAANQLTEYFEGNRKKFDIPLYIEGTEFRKQVWRALTEIPYGTTATYKDIAKAIGNDKAVRAVGGANNKNKLPIVIPCHRVIGSNGELVGYAGGLQVKQKLLELESSKL